MNKNIIRNTQLENFDFSDKRRKSVMVLDVETALSEGYEQLIFDLGWTVANLNQEKMIIHRSYIVEEIFLDMKLMERAYYFKKYPQYVKALAEGRAELKPFNEIIAILEQDIKDYNVYRMFAYNSKFDSTAINVTHKYLYNNTSELKYDINCLWSLSTQTFMATEKFVLTAVENGWVSEKGNIKTSAEIAYRYLTGDHDFVEAHTALEDSIVETKLLFKIKNYSQKDYESAKQPWRRIKEIKDKMGLEL